MHFVMSGVPDNSWAMGRGGCCMVTRQKKNQISWLLHSTVLSIVLNLDSRESNNGQEVGCPVTPQRKHQLMKLSHCASQQFFESLLNRNLLLIQMLLGQSVIQTHPSLWTRDWLGELEGKVFTFSLCQPAVLALVAIPQKWQKKWVLTDG